MTSSDLAIVFSTIRRPTGTIMAPPKPCRMRGGDQLGQRSASSPQNTEPIVKMMIAVAEDRARAESIGHPAADRNEDGEAQQVGGDREVELDRIFVQRPGHRGQRGRDDRRVEHLHEERAADDHRREEGVGRLAQRLI